MLFALVILDSWSTAYLFQTESNIMFVWLMDKFNLTLGQVMIGRVFYYIPLIYILDRFGGKKYVSLTIMLYIAIYQLMFWVSYL